MKYSIISIIVLTLAAVTAAGQSEKPSALVDSFGRIGCGDAQARTDMFVSELWNNPGAGGLINVNPDAADPVPAFVKLQEITSQLKARRFDESRISILISPPRREMSIQFWKELPGGRSGPPEPDSPPAMYDLSPLTRPIMFGSTVSAEGPVCGQAAFDVNVFALAMSQIPSVKARVVVKARNATRAKAIRAKLREELEKRIEPTAITWVNTKSMAEGTELWLVPEKKSAAEQVQFSALRDIEKYSGDIEKYPDDPDAYVMRARAYVKLDRTGEAVDDLTKAIALSKHPYYVAQATTDRGEVYLKRGEYAKAATDLSAVIGLAGAEPYKPGAFLNRARVLIAQGNTAEARKDANEAIKLYSAMKARGAKKKLGEAYKLRAAINCVDGKSAAAKADNLKAVSLGATSSKCGLK